MKRRREREKRKREEQETKEILKTACTITQKRVQFATDLVFRSFERL